ncbi:hypothetical protein [Streptomyces sp. FH025]|uniref:hypothetical protein n=1 Tax=Streptomyces sp. FH025 TaxID=2815937 RepID=UPI001A9D5C6A|nr:hypothetical protein [Streptomyces sp. FH025]MBO1420126.1 hypothetical protein [Streptomyces sp. FH025]
MRMSHIAKRVAVLATLPVLGVTIAAGTASATEANYVLWNSSACEVTEQITVINGHDYMQADPNRNDSTCAFAIRDNNANSIKWYSTGGSLSGWVYDGPGQSLSVGVYSSNTGYWVWGPAN